MFITGVVRGIVETNCQIKGSIVRQGTS